MIYLKRAWDPPEPGEGRRFLVDRLWPRGIKKNNLALAGWLRSVAPSTPLRKWFNHEAAKWKEFQRRYTAELEANPGSWTPLLDLAVAEEITLVYAARDRVHNQAVALREYLLAKAKAVDRVEPRPTRPRMAQRPSTRIS